MDEVILKLFLTDLVIWLTICGIKYHFCTLIFIFTGKKTIEFTMEWHFVGFVSNKHGFLHLETQICQARHLCSTKLRKAVLQLIPPWSKLCTFSFSWCCDPALRIFLTKWPNAAMSLCLRTFWNQTQIFKTFNTEKQDLFSCCCCSTNTEMKLNQKNSQKNNNTMKTFSQITMFVC